MIKFISFIVGFKNKDDFYDKIIFKRGEIYLIKSEISACGRCAPLVEMT